MINFERHMIQIDWKIKSFNTLETDELYGLLKLRVDVFVVEQKCPYHELDNKDQHPEAFHLIGKNKEGEILTYLRILPPGLSFEQASIGRVVVAKKVRGQGLCEKMLKKGLGHIYRIWTGTDVQIGAQVYLMKLYQALGFEAVSDTYLEDGIPHINMIKKCTWN